MWGAWWALTCNAGSHHAWDRAAAGNLLLSGGLEQDVKKNIEMLQKLINQVWSAPMYKTNDHSSWSYTQQV